MANAKENSKSTLGYLGVDFQYRLINSFFVEPSFFTDLNQIIDQNMFTDSNLRAIVTVIKEYYAKYDSMPTYDIVAIKLNERALNDDDREYYAETIDKLKHTSTDGYQEIEDMAERFFKQQNIIKVANKLRTIAGDGDISKYDECQQILEEAMAIGRRVSDTTRPFESIDADLSPNNTTFIPTGIGRLDEILGGGLEKGKLGLIIAPMGTGKTTITTCISANSATCKREDNEFKGYKVLHIVFEDKPRDMHRKYMGKVTQIETKDLSKSQETIDTVKEILSNSPEREMMNNNIRIMKLYTGEHKASSIREIIKKKINEGFYPDLVVIDYFECIEPENGGAKSDANKEEGRTMRKFENMAEELNVAMWIPTQGNRESISAEIVTNDKIGGSIKKNQIAQVVISIARSQQDIRNKKATIAVLKNRSGGAGNTLNGVIFDNGTCTINTDNVIEFDDDLAYDEYLEEQEEQKRKSIKEGLKKNYKK